MRPLECVGLASNFLISSTGTALQGLASFYWQCLMPSHGILSRGNWNVSGHVLDLRNGELLLLGVLQSDKSRKLSVFDGLDGGGL